MNYRFHILIIIVLSLCLIMLSGCEQTNQLERIKQRGELVVATRTAPTSYHQGAHGLEGLEYDLVSQFAESEGLNVRFVVSNEVHRIIQSVRHGEVHMASAGLSDTSQRRKSLKFSQHYQTVSEKLIYRRGNKRPRSLSDLNTGQLHVIADSSHTETLEAYRQDFPALNWISDGKKSADQLLHAVNRGDIDFTIADSNDLAMAQLVYRHIKPAFTLSHAQKLAWAFPKQIDNSLHMAADRFLNRIKNDGTLKQLIERYYGHRNRLNFVDKRDFQRHYQDRLPKYLNLFKKAGEHTNTDWRILAAIGYQESHWRPKAVSPTGVRGIMMLTRTSAKRVGVKNRHDPQQSIEGGAKYLKIVEKKIPARIKGLNRLWLTLAGYNVGFGHLEDARILTQRQGGNPDLWMDVKKRLPLLTRKKYYSTLKRGFARGHEPVTYVENIRNYYDLIVWYEKNPQALIEQ